MVDQGERLVMERAGAGRERSSGLRQPAKPANRAADGVPAGYVPADAAMMANILLVRLGQAAVLCEGKILMKKVNNG